MVDSKLPPIILTRPKMPRATWEALRAHIIRGRLRKKQDREITQEYERQKKERERKKKQEALTLEETKEQIEKLEKHLVKLKENKDQLFNSLKKVLYEEETRRRSKESGLEPHPHPHLYLQPNTGRPSPMYHIRPPNAPNMMSGSRASSMAAQNIQAKRSSPPLQRGDKAPTCSTPITVNPAFTFGPVAGVKSYGYLQNSPGTVGSASGLTRVNEQDHKQYQPANRPPYTSLERERNMVAAQVAAAAHQRAVMPGVPPPAAHSGSSVQQLYRPGNVISGYPRYTHPSLNNGGGSSQIRYYHRPASQSMMNYPPRGDI